MMIEQLEDMADPQFATQWVIMGVLALLLIWKCLPDVKAALEHWRSRANRKESLEATVKRHDKEIADINDKLGRDYEALNRIDKAMRAQKKSMDESLEEREILMKGLLACLKGLQELGTNGVTKEAQGEIEAYINKQAHEPRRDEND